jgi:hypothetical protein
LNKTNNIHMTSIGGNIFMENEVLMQKNRGFCVHIGLELKASGYLFVAS